MNVFLFFLHYRMFLTLLLSHTVQRIEIRRKDAKVLTFASPLLLYMPLTYSGLIVSHAW